jgi:HK97 gp10 family phage protein
MGFKIIENNKDKVLEELEGAIEEALGLAGMQAENYARANAPVDTGRLRNSITSQVLKGENAVVIGTNVEYAPYQELSTSKMPACNNGRGFLRPAINDHIDEYKNIIIRELSE